MTSFEALLTKVDDAFVRAAQDEELVDVAIAEVDTPIGRLLLATTDVGIVRLEFDLQSRDEILNELAATVSPRVLEIPARLDAARRQIDEYFSGDRVRFDLPLDLRLVLGPFRREVVDAIAEIPYGDTRTYTELAQVLRRPKAMRAVGSGCANNPVPIIVPCHRVLQSGGGLGGYRGGVARKEWLLRHEGYSAA